MLKRQIGINLARENQGFTDFLEKAIGSQGRPILINVGMLAEKRKSAPKPQPDATRRQFSE